MKRRYLDDEEHESGNQNPDCAGVISSFFCPPTHVTTAPPSGEAFIQSEFDKLPPDEQERIYRDLYGLDYSVARMEEDDPNLLGRKLNELESEIDAITKSKGAYQEALTLCPGHLEKTKVMFIRAEVFDAKKAARRLVKHWSEKVQLFGFDRAMRGSIQQSELDEGDMESLASGGIQILPGKDRAGRTIFWGRREHFRYRTIDNLLRAFWYLVMAQLESDEDSQKNGWVSLVYNVGPYHLEYFDRDMYSRFLKTVKVLPVRIVGYHSCFNDLKLRTVTPFTLLFMGKETRARYRSHVGSHAECLFEIMTYGIPLDLVPVSMDGRFDQNPHLRWLDRMREIEMNSMNE